MCKDENTDSISLTMSLGLRAVPVGIESENSEKRLVNSGNIPVGSENIEVGSVIGSVVGIVVGMVIVGKDSNGGTPVGKSLASAEIMLSISD